MLNNTLQLKVNQLNNTPANILHEVVEKCKSLEEINKKLTLRVEKLEKINIVNLKQFEKQAETISKLFRNYCFWLSVRCGVCEALPLFGGVLHRLKASPILSVQVSL